MLQLVGEGVLDVLAGWTVLALGGRLYLGVERLVQAAELQLVLVDGIQQTRLLSAGGGGIEGVVVL
jgi:hypothetical protein